MLSELIGTNWLEMLENTTSDTPNHSPVILPIVLEKKASQREMT